MPYIPGIPQTGMAQAVQGLMSAREARRSRQDRNRQLAMQLAARGGGQVFQQAGDFLTNVVRQQMENEARLSAERAQIEANRPLREAQKASAEATAEWRQRQLQELGPKPGEEGLTPEERDLKRKIDLERRATAVRREEQGMLGGKAFELTPKQLKHGSMFEQGIEPIVQQEIGGQAVSPEYIRSLSPAQIAALFVRTYPKLTEPQRAAWASELSRLRGPGNLEQLYADLIAQEQKGREALPPPEYRRFGKKPLQVHPLRQWVPTRDEVPMDEVIANEAEVARAIALQQALGMILHREAAEQPGEYPGIIPEQEQAMQEELAQILQSIVLTEAAKTPWKFDPQLLREDPWSNYLYPDAEKRPPFKFEW